MRKQIAAANWKMNLTLLEANTLAEQFLQEMAPAKSHQLVVLAVPFPYLTSIQQIVAATPNVFVAAQDCSAYSKGAYTGDTSVAMLQSIGIQYALVGHSERREYQMESNALLAQKVNQCLEAGITPIFCCGEPLNVREEEKQAGYVAHQLKESLFHLSAEQIQKVVIAYEPIWAIGTGKTASSDQARDMHAHIREAIQIQYSAAVAQSISILYGGSVKAANANEIFTRSDVDGGLVGGASLVATEFAAIAQALR